MDHANSHLLAVQNQHSSFVFPFCKEILVQTTIQQILMLFTAWRNEDVDLLKGCKTYEESYFQQKDVIESTRSGYERIKSTSSFLHAVNSIKICL
jgi:hypothetical protein